EVKGAPGAHAPFELREGRLETEHSDRDLVARARTVGHDHRLPVGCPAGSSRALGRPAVNRARPAKRPAANGAMSMSAPAPAATCSASRPPAGARPLPLRPSPAAV